MVEQPPNDQSVQVEETIDHLREMHQHHLDQTPMLQRYADRATTTLGRPGALILSALVAGVWLVANYELNTAGYQTVDPPPFVVLEVAATLAGLFTALLILTTQRHDDELAEKRAELTLQIAVLSEKKVAKVIALLEEQRRDNPMLADRADADAEALAQTTDPNRSLERIEDVTPTTGKKI